MIEALFERVAQDRVLPTPFSRGPWSAGALHGGAVAALFAGELEALPAPDAMQPARLTVELVRPVPLTTLEIRTRVVRPGRKIDLAEAELLAGGKVVALARLLRIRVQALPLPPGVAERTADPVPPPPEDAPPLPGPLGDPGPIAYHWAATEHRQVKGSWDGLGRATDWIRLRVPVVGGAAISPFQRVAAAADFANGISAELPFTEWLFLNPDLSIHLQRQPVDEWVCLDARTLPGESGAATTESALFDRKGRIGRTMQSVLLEQR